jgi:hypothetical protein
MMRWALSIVGISLVACAEAPATTSPPPTIAARTIADARGTLAQASIARRPAVPLYVSVVEADLGRTDAITEQREPGFELVITGRERITAGTAAPISVEGGQAVFVQGDAVTRFESDGTAVSYFVSLRPAGSRSRTLAGGRRALYESADCRQR